MNARFKISAVICSYNRARFIIDAIESIFNQDFDKSLYEVIVVDNNSTDGTLERLQNFKVQHATLNFSFFTETNQGVAHTRTRCAKVFVVAKAGILPLPLAPNPIFVFAFVQV